MFDLESRRCIRCRESGRRLLDESDVAGAGDTSRGPVVDAKSGTVVVVANQNSFPRFWLQLGGVTLDMNEGAGANDAEKKGSPACRTCGSTACPP